MDLSREPQAIARAAAEEIRALNHRTLESKSLPYPGDVSATAENIAVMLQRLPQTLEQLQASLQGMADRGEIRMDNGADPSVAALEAGRRLWDAQERIRSAGSAMQEAVNQLARMGAHWDAADEDEDGERA